MKKPFLLIVLLLALASCQTDADIRPASYDELAMAAGHWEWDSSGLGDSYYNAPASAGYTRQLVFGPDHQLRYGVAAPLSTTPAISFPSTPFRHRRAA